jgi:hypothetical protein
MASSSMRSEGEGTLPAQEYPFVLTNRLGTEVYDALQNMMDDRLGQQLVAMEGRVNIRFTSLDGKFAAVDEKFAAIDAKFAVVDAKFEAMNTKFTALDVKLEAKLSALSDRVERRLVEEIGGLRAEMLAQRGDLLKWAMVFWVSQAAAVAGIVAVLR